MEETVPLRAVESAAPVLPTPLAPSAAAPSATDLSLFETGSSGRAGEDAGGELVGPAGGAAARRRRRRAGLLAAAGAAVAVVAAVGVGAGLLSYDTPSRDGAVPDDVRAAVPDTVTARAEEPGAGAVSPSASRSTASPSGGVSASASASVSASASASGGASPSVSPSRSGAAGRPESTPTGLPTPAATGSPWGDTVAPGDGGGVGAGDGDGDGTGAPVLRRGDRGPEVVELQLRLRQLYLYTGEANGIFNGQVESALRNYQWARGVTNDGLGVYGPQTRRSLESETRTP
ncbi:peptidoglycan-binding protein [Streptomyces sp. NPDC058733]|uniref:peptidoglycan-binding domain-containing protein n=1 Tax=Streptomyces sp. NPDC058733 TaxID=3346614 RepID=UPI0036AD26E3